GFQEGFFPMAFLVGNQNLDFEKWGSQKGLMT
ncbi:hypothetical protein CGSSp19BS75_00150, partial [Streptococcus pneumoniae SP19-BS75]